MPRTATPVSLSRSAMTGPSVWPSYGLPCRALACSTNCPPWGAVAGVVAAELVGGTGLSFADALHLGRVQRVDLRPALTLLLMAHTQRQIEQRAEAVFERCVALDLAADVADDAAEPGVQELKLPPGALELMGMRIAPDHDGGALGHPQIALAQLDTLAFGQIDQLLDRAMGEPGVGRMRDRFLLHGGIHHDPLEIFGLDRPAPVGHREALLQQRGDLLLTQPLAPSGH